MRFIHTADWHLGNLMHEIDRREEVSVFLRWLKAQIIEKKADTLIVAGDVFDTANPSVESRKFYYTFLASLADTCCKNVIVIGGNHDSAVMLDSAKELLEVLNIRVVGSINDLDFSQMCFELRDSDDDVCGICMAVPFVREIELRKFLPDEKIPDCDLYSVAYKKLYAKVFEQAEKMRFGRNIPIIATGHLYASDLEGRLAEKKSNEKSDDGMKVLDVLGTLGNVPPSVFPKADYVALGHIHYSTTVAKKSHIRYSGSPFVMGFDEAERPHFVLFGELGFDGEKSSLNIEKIETPKTFLYKRISGTLAQIKDELENLSSINTSKTAEKNGMETKIELCYKRELGVSAQDFLEDSIRKLPENISVVSWKIMDIERSLNFGVGEGFESVEIKNLDDKEIFTQLILSKTGLNSESDEGKDAIKKFLPLFLQLAGEN